VRSNAGRGSGIDTENRSHVCPAADRRATVFEIAGRPPQSANGESHIGPRWVRH
jgi:hypothetical protein